MPIMKSAHARCSLLSKPAEQQYAIFVAAITYLLTYLLLEEVLIRTFPQLSPLQKRQRGALPATE